MLHLFMLLWGFFFLLEPFYLKQYELVKFLAPSYPQTCPLPFFHLIYISFQMVTIFMFIQITCLTACLSQTGLVLDLLRPC